VLKPQDIVVLLKLALQVRGWTFQGIAGELGMSASAVHRSLDRAARSGLYKSGPKEVDRRALAEYLVHGLRYSFPPQWGGEARGVPTAWAAPPLAQKLSVSGDNPPVWPDPRGDTRGIALEPLHARVPEAARRDPSLRELLALVDAIRIGGARERDLATSRLEKMILRPRGAG
jgi:hypothetical protein